MRAKAETKKTTDAVAILDRMAGESPELRRLTEEARLNASVAQLIYAARNKAGLSQAELAERGGSRWRRTTHAWFTPRTTLMPAAPPYNGSIKSARGLHPEDSC